ncbi:MAG: MurR/RpiR family transcriptional regulator [Pseudomonadota bacterium]
MISHEDLTRLLVDKHETLPAQLQLISQFVLDHPQQVALMTIADISAEVGVQPSSVIRFSKAIGFNGFSEVQRILRSAITDQMSSNYFARLQNGDRSEVVRFASLAEQSLQNLPSEADIAAAADLMASAQTIHILGMRRAFAIATSLHYLLSGFGAPVNLLNPVAGMGEAMMSTVRQGDALIAISFPFYTPLTLETLATAQAKGVRLISITDSAVSPIAKDAEVLLLTDQGVDGGFRSTTGSMVTAQALAASYGKLKAV